MKPNKALQAFELNDEDIRALGPPQASVVLFSGADTLILRAHSRLAENDNRSDVNDYIGSARNEAIIDQARTNQTLRMIIDCAIKELPPLSKDDIAAFWEQESK